MRTNTFLALSIVFALFCGSEALRSIGVSNSKIAQSSLTPYYQVYSFNWKTGFLANKELNLWDEASFVGEDLFGKQGFCVCATRLGTVGNGAIQYIRFQTNNESNVGEIVEILNVTSPNASCLILPADESGSVVGLNRRSLLCMHSKSGSSINHRELIAATPTPLTMLAGGFGAADFSSLTYWGFVPTTDGANTWYKIRHNLASQGGSVKKQTASRWFTLTTLIKNPVDSSLSLIGWNLENKNILRGNKVNLETGAKGELAYTLVSNRTSLLSNVVLRKILFVKEGVEDFFIVVYSTGSGNAAVYAAEGFSLTGKSCGAYLLPRFFLPIASDLTWANVKFSLGSASDPEFGNAASPCRANEDCVLSVRDRSSRNLRYSFGSSRAPEYFPASWKCNGVDYAPAPQQPLSMTLGYRRCHEVVKCVSDGSSFSYIAWNVSNPYGVYCTRVLASRMPGCLSHIAEDAFGRIWGVNMTRRTLVYIPPGISPSTQVEVAQLWNSNIRIARKDVNLVVDENANVVVVSWSDVNNTRGFISVPFQMGTVAVPTSSSSSTTPAGQSPLSQIVDTITFDYRLGIVGWRLSPGFRSIVGLRFSYNTKTFQDDTVYTVNLPSPVPGAVERVMYNMKAMQILFIIRIVGNDGTNFGCHIGEDGPDYKLVRYNIFNNNAYFETVPTNFNELYHMNDVSSSTICGSQYEIQTMPPQPPQPEPAPYFPPQPNPPPSQPQPYSPYAPGPEENLDSCAPVTYIYNTSGYLSMSRYRNNLSCKWYFYNAQNLTVYLWFDLESGFDFLKFSRLDMYGSPYLIAAYSGNSMNVLNNTGVVFDGPIMMSFESDSSQAGYGWSLSYVVNSSDNYYSPTPSPTPTPSYNTTGNCSTATYLYSNYGSFYYNYYTDNQNCSWYISPGGYYNYIDITFYYIDTETSYDYVSVYYPDPYGYGEILLWNFTGVMSFSYNVRVPSYTARVNFRSDGSQTRTGFSAYYMAGNNGSTPSPPYSPTPTYAPMYCNGTTTYNSTYEMYISFYNYAYNQTCNYSVLVPGALYIDVSVSQLNLNNNSEYLVFYGRNNRVVANYTGNVGYVNFRVDGNAMKIFFSTRSNDSYSVSSYNNFYISYNAFVPPPPFRCNSSMTTITDQYSSMSPYTYSRNQTCVFKYNISGAIYIDFALSFLDIESNRDFFIISTSPILNRTTIVANLTGNLWYNYYRVNGSVAYITFVTARTATNMSKIGFNLYVSGSVPAPAMRCYYPYYYYSQFSSLYINNIENYQDCYFVITPNNVSAINITLNLFLGNSYDNITVYNSTDASPSTVVRTINYNFQYPISVYVSNGTAMIRVRTSGGLPANVAFSADWNSVVYYAPPSYSYCNRDNYYYDSNATISIGNNPAQNQNCSYYISVSNGQYTDFVINFNDFSYGESLQIFSYNGTALASFTGSQYYTRYFRFDGGNFVLLYVSPNYNTTTVTNGFSLYYTTYAPPPIYSCYGMPTYFYDTYGSFSTQGYQRGQNCLYLVNVSRASYIYLTIYYVDVEMNRDFVAVYNSTTDLSKKNLIANLTGNVPGFYYTVNGPQFALKFTSANPVTNNSKYGLSFYYSAYVPAPPFSCYSYNNVYADYGYGTISSFDSSGYLRNQNCSYYINLTKSKNISFYIEVDLDVQDRLVISNNSTGSKVAIGNYVGQQRIDNFNLMAKNLIVDFFTGSSVTNSSKRGFYVSFNLVYSYCPYGLILNGTSGSLSLPQLYTGQGCTFLVNITGLARVNRIDFNITWDAADPMDNLGLYAGYMTTDPLLLRVFNSTTYTVYNRNFVMVALQTYYIAGTNMGISYRAS